MESYAIAAAGTKSFNGWIIMGPSSLTNTPLVLLNDGSLSFLFLVLRTDSENILLQLKLNAL